MAIEELRERLKTVDLLIDTWAPDEDDEYFSALVWERAALLKKLEAQRKTNQAADFKEDT